MDYDTWCRSTTCFVQVHDGVVVEVGEPCERIRQHTGEGKYPEAGDAKPTNTVVEKIGPGEVVSKSVLGMCEQEVESDFEVVAGEIGSAAEGDSRATSRSPNVPGSLLSFMFFPTASFVFSLFRILRANPDPIPNASVISVVIWVPIATCWFTNTRIDFSYILTSQSFRQACT